MRLKAGSVPEGVSRISLSDLAGKLSGGSKFGNRKTERDGILFDSQLEADRWGELCLMQQCGIICDLCRQVSYKMVVDGVLICTYRADFVYTEVSSGLVVAEDCKGFSTDVYRLKKRLLKALYSLEIVEIRKNK
ncbi:DUF1064 domain-containing protein [Armatimonas sp.]|uniref:DUF1064 domain-containing protein n=1 Tax=Armatimonas sp. TaxID=1872638 RepID=UPI003753033F